MEFIYNKWKKYVHDNWKEYSARTEEDKHFFVSIDLAEMQKAINKIEKSLQINFPTDLKEFYENLGGGYLWANRRDKIGIYSVLEPIEIYDLYYPYEEEDLFATYRKNAWENLESNLLAFCVIGEEDALLYYNIDDGGIYYLSTNRKIAGSLGEFYEQIDKDVDYFIGK